MNDYDGDSENEIDNESDNIRMSHNSVYDSAENVTVWHRVGGVGGRGS